MTTFELLIASWIVMVILAVCLFFAERECLYLRARLDEFFPNCGHRYDLLHVDCAACNKALCLNCAIYHLIADMEAHSCKNETCRDQVSEDLRRVAFEAHVTTYKELEEENLPEKPSRISSLMHAFDITREEALRLYPGCDREEANER